MKPLYTPSVRTERQMPSGTDTSAGERRKLPDPVVRAQLETILASDVFSRSQHLRRFLSFIVEQRLAGQEHSLKESVLANELYGKGTDFDGGTDPVVRVDARRLRDKLREYYEGRSDPVVISLPKGSYVPVFEANSGSSTYTASTVLAVEPQPTPRVPTLRRATVAVGGLAIVAAALAAAFMWRTFRTTADAPVQLLPLASYPGSEGPPALSPDGNLVAFAWSGGPDAGPTDIYVKAVGSEALRQLTATPASEMSPAWSIDGHTIAFARERQGVFTMSQLGGAERRVSVSGTHVAWASDSKSVLIRDREANGGPFGIYQVFLDTLERRRLTQPHLGPGDWRFAVSPDGKTLAFIRYDRDGIADLYVVPMHGGEPQRLSNWNSVLTGLSWTADGREIVYSVEEPAASRLWRIHADSARPGRGSPIADIPVAAVNPSISKPMPGQPARLVFQTITRDVDIHLMDLEAPRVNGAIGSMPFANSTRIESSARFSPDGSRIAFESDRSGGFEIWVAKRDGTGLQQITSLGAPDLLIGGWSPDGGRIAFDAPIAGNDDVYVVGTDGGHLRRLTADPSVDGVVSWSGDGRWIYFSSTRAGPIPDIWRMSADGGPATRTTHNGGFDPKESPDGRYLFYLDRHPAGLAIEGTARLMRLPVGGGQEELMLEGVQPFLWSVTDTGILFVTREPDFDAMDVYRFSDRRVVRAGRLAFRVPWGFRNMAVSRDGRWALATRMVRSDADLMRLEDFR
jgi:Tol biopolymer transport system component